MNTYKFILTLPTSLPTQENPVVIKDTIRKTTIFGGEITKVIPYINSYDLPSQKGIVPWRVKDYRIDIESLQSYTIQALAGLIVSTLRLRLYDTSFIDEFIIDVGVKYKAIKESKKSKRIRQMELNI